RSDGSGAANDLPAPDPPPLGDTTNATSGGDNVTDEFHAVIRDADGQIVGVRRPKPAEPEPAQVALTASITEATARRLGDVVERLDRAAQIDIEAVQHAARVEQEAKVAFTAGHQQMREAEAIALQAGVALAHARRER